MMPTRLRGSRGGQHLFEVASMRWIERLELRSRERLPFAEVVIQGATERVPRDRRLQLRQTESTHGVAVLVTRNGRRFARYHHTLLPRRRLAAVEPAV